MTVAGGGRVVVLMLMLVSCSVSPSEGDGSDVASTTGSALESDVGEVVELLSSSGSSIDRHNLHQEAIASCMRDRGFEYTPLPAPSEVMLSSVVVAPLGVRREFLESYGYGVTTLYWDLELEAARARGVDSNPNEQRLSTMSEPERRAFQAALLGPVVSTDSGSEGVDAVVRDKTESCEEEAQEATRLLNRDRLPGALQEALEETMERVYADPTVTAADDAWFACMADAGHLVERPAIMEGQRVGPMFPTGEQLVHHLADNLNATAEWSVLTVQQGDGTTETVEYPIFDESLLAQAQETELTIARADLACDGETERSETILSVRDALYEQVVRDNLSVFMEAVSD